ncbi:unnamed protein product [Penicillium camemberti]|uniref:Str. FM013 n=1 Tax=Penicillium camemberti (strain FM 013) TaxID=1429867 RepID=A0A0G4NSK3_PENC3|nr:unnamed protein product [Penicillium camemberti]
MANEHELTPVDTDARLNGIVRRLVFPYQLFLRDRIFWPPAKNKHMSGTTPITR